MTVPSAQAGSNSELTGRPVPEANSVQILCKCCKLCANLVKFLQKKIVYLLWKFVQSFVQFFPVALARILQNLCAVVWLLHNCPSKSGDNRINAHRTLIYICMSAQKEGISAFETGVQAWPMPSCTPPKCRYSDWDCSLKVRTAAGGPAVGSRITAGPAQRRPAAAPASFLWGQMGAAWSAN